MIPNPSYFPTNLQARAAWFQNFSIQAQGAQGVSLGLTAAEQTQIEDDNNIVQFLAETDVTVNAYDDAIRGYRRTITEGDVGDPTPAFPANITLTLPTPVPTGIFQRLDQFVKRIRVSPAYTPEIGALFGISNGSPIPGEPQKKLVHLEAGAAPKIAALATPGNIVRVKFVRGTSDGIYVETLIDNETAWNAAGRFLKSPAMLTVPQNAGNLPRQAQIRARFLDGNDPVGDWCDIATVQTIP